MLARIEQVTGQSWVDAVTKQQTFSEWTLYGIFVEEVIKHQGAMLTESSLCHSYWGTVPLTIESAADFVSKINSDDVAILIQSKTHTSRVVRRQAIDAFDFRRNNPSESAPTVK
jgi:ribosomal protein L16 Arg81 hydroxylase